MNQKTYYKVTGGIFLVIAFLHLWRALSGWESVINGWSVPLWLSWVVVVVAGYLAYEGLVGSSREK